MSATFYPATRRHIPEDRNLHEDIRGQECEYYIGRGKSAPEMFQLTPAEIWKWSEIPAAAQSCPLRAGHGPQGLHSLHQRRHAR
jgi:hypothetical protein